MRAAAFCAAIALIAAPVRGESYREGLFGYEIADYAAAHLAWSSCAEAGDYRCQFGLGVLLNAGQGVAQDHREALRWFTAAAEQGSTDAALELGILYAIGPGEVEQDPIAAYAWMLVAARNGDPVAENRRELTASLLSEDASLRMTGEWRLERVE